MIDSSLLPFLKRDGDDRGDRKLELRGVYKEPSPSQKEKKMEKNGKMKGGRSRERERKREGGDNLGTPSFSMYVQRESTK